MEKSNCINCGKDDNSLDSKYCSICGYELPKNKNESLLEKEQKKIPIKKNNKKPRINALIGVLVFFISYFAVQKIFFKQPNYEKAMMEWANEFNKSCPFMVDANTRLDNTIALPKNIFQYNYTLVNIEKGTADIEEMKNYLEPSLTNLVKTNPEMKFQREHKTTLKYNYKDKNGVFLFNISVTPDKYK